MTTSTTPRRPASGRSSKTPLKSPLAMPSAAPSHAGISAAEGLGALLTDVVLTDRGATISEFEDYLRTTNNRNGRPYEEKTIENYAGPCRNLDTWMTATRASPHTSSATLSATPGSNPAALRAI
jgi:hypothetical protein